jgi:hypothetical protein
MIKWLLTIVLAVLIIGSSTPWIRDLVLRKFGYRRMPGDIDIERNGKRFRFPIGSTILLSLVATLIFWLLR